MLDEVYDGRPKKESKAPAFSFGGGAFKDFMKGETSEA
jgi:hypothetical protein